MVQVLFEYMCSPFFKGGSSQKLSASLPRDAFDRVAEFTTHAQLAQHRKVKGRHLEKFQKLRNSRADLDKDWRNSGDSGLDSKSEKWVKNIFDRDLTKNEVSVLAKGLNYAVVPESVPVAEFVTVTESAVSLARLNPSDAETLRHKICETLCNTELPQSNITKDERKALSELTKDENIAIVPADKGKCVVVLNKCDYDDKCNDLLKDEKTYKRVGYNPTSGYRKKVTEFTTKILTEKTINIDDKRQLDPPSEPAVPAFYGLPKIHKPEPIPVRPIVSSIGSVTYNLAKNAAKILGPLVGQSPHHIKNTQEFVNRIKDITLSEGETITSYDVTALFTCIPPDFALKVVKECLNNDTTLIERTNLNVDQIVELVSICLNTTYFSYQGKFYKQHGVAMGSPVSPIVVNLCMESFEQQVLQSYPGVKPRLWLRFVDDTFVIIERTELEGFFQHINKLDDKIKFTQESCKDDTLAFLDCLISVKSDGSLTSNVYRKPTHTDHYLQFGSHHPLIHKLGVIRTLQYRADTIISENDLIPEEKDHIKESLKNCGYPNWAFLKANKSRKDQKQSDGGGQPNKARVTIPYIAGLSERVKKHLKAFGISSSFKPNNTLRGKLVQVKDKQSKEKRSNLVYGLVCGDADCSAACWQNKTSLES
ncbi:uncharacterized protein [Amphiura filiformis]|uniref:uncharacterized protein n=1 Tax=Amphiura filiformis TaxID=82378 RepID=UPI003B2253CA